MSNSAGAIAPKPLALPSDQDASGRTFGTEELAGVERVLNRGTLVSTKGPEVKEFEAAFAAMTGAPYATANSSGSAAVHGALACIDPEPGSEVITTAITDMGAITPILYQGAIPVFADVDPRTCNVTAESIEAAITDRTRAVIVTHLFGSPCDMDAIMDVACKHGLPIIEDSAQALLATSQGRHVGTMGLFGTFSFQQGKHITCGEGGITITLDPVMARRLYLWTNKGFGYGNEKPDHDFIALNGRMTEVQGAILLAQLGKLEGVVKQRRAMANLLSAQIKDIEGIATPFHYDGDEHSYWKYCLNVDLNTIPGGPTAVGNALKTLGVASAPRYIQKPAYECTIFTEQQTFGTSRWPFTLARPEAIDYTAAKLPNTYKALAEVLVLPWNEKYTETHVTFLAEALRWAVAEARKTN
jgi:perosamine synthetase